MSVTVSSGQTYYVSSGQTDTGDIVLSGGAIDVLQGGGTINALVSAVGSISISLGGITTGTSLSGGFEYIFQGGTASERRLN
jgi:hypothetical protein